MRSMAKWLFVAVMALGSAALAEDITGFTCIGVQGECQYKADAGYAAITVGQVFPFGTEVKTGRRSSLDMQFSDNNTFKLLSRTTLTITEDVRNPKLKVLKLASGQIDIKLDAFPQGNSLKVETPTAVCGAVGTRFAVSFEYDPNAPDSTALAGSRQQSFSCNKGEVFVASRFEVKGKQTEGQSFEVPSLKGLDGGLASQLIATIHEGKENSYTDITVQRGHLTFNFGDDKGKGMRFTAEAQEDGTPTSFVCALEKSASTIKSAALQVNSGTVTNTKSRFLGKDETTDITAAKGAVIIDDQEVLEPDKPMPVIGQYIAAAKTEGEKHSELVDAERAEVRDAARIARLQAEVDAAAKKATDLRNRMLAKQTLRSLRLIRQGANRMRNMPRR